MAHVTLDNLVVGVIVASDVCDRSGRRLLAAGTKLTNDHLTTLRSWGIPTIEIAGEELDQPDSATDSIDPALRSILEEEAGRRFRHMDLIHPAVSTLFEICIKRLAKDRKDG
ncbi:MAG TPA: hypothetical protein ENI80_11365 [Acidiferrobacteraceae bacterium]|nr:hypothetical protein [Acidiferrobacteraceae bacterium]